MCGQKGSKLKTIKRVLAAIMHGAVDGILSLIKPETEQDPEQDQEQEQE